MRLKKQKNKTRYWVVFGLVVLIAVAASTQIGSTLDVEGEPRHNLSATSTEEVIVEDLDVIEEARRELERINVELDEEEEKLISEIDKLKARVEKIRETRESFQ